LRRRKTASAVSEDVIAEVRSLQFRKPPATSPSEADDERNCPCGEDGRELAGVTNDGGEDEALFVRKHAF
jgi:hypothetical protein